MNDIFAKFQASSAKKFRKNMFLITLLVYLAAVLTISGIDLGIYEALYDTGGVTTYFKYIFTLLLTTFIPLALLSFILITLLTNPIYRVLVKLENNEDVSEKEITYAKLRTRRVPTIILIINLLTPIIIGIITTLVNHNTVIGVSILKDVSIFALISVVQISLYQSSLSYPKSQFKIFTIDRDSKEWFARYMQRIQLYASVLFAITTMIYVEVSITEYMATVIEEMKPPALTEERISMMDRLHSQIGENGKKLPDLAQENIDKIKSKSIILVLLSFFYSIAVIVFANIIIDRAKSIQINILKKVLHDISEGEADLTQRVIIVQADDTGELSELINRLMSRFQELFRHITESANKVSNTSKSIGSVLYSTISATEEMVAAVSQINSNTDKYRGVVSGSRDSLNRAVHSLDSITDHVTTQAAFVDQTSAAMEEMVANINSVNQVTSKANSLAEILTKISSKGGSAVTDSIQAVREIETSSAEVSTLIGIISKILAQTNILAMNAAIEAAHAGDVGRGFAVVAEEVRNLADTSSANLKIINENIKDVLNKVDNGVHLSEEAGEALTEVGEKTIQTTSLMSEVAHAMDEQVAGANEVLSSINSLVESSGEIKRLSHEQQQINTTMKSNLEETINAFNEVQSATKELEVGNGEIMNNISSLKKVIEENERVVKELENNLAGYKV